MTDLPAEQGAHPDHPPEGWQHRACLFAVFALATVPVAGAFTLSRAFLVRDLTYYFWPRYRWLRQTVWNGEWPWWDPFVSGGQAVAGDALGQLFLLPTLALRLLLPEPVGFNLWVALPMPLSALGAYAFFRRYASPTAAALGALTFGLSGPMLSTGNFLNLSWTTVFLPWLLRAADRAAARRSARSLVAVSLLFAGQICAGEPLIAAVTAVLVVAWVATMSEMTADGPLLRLRVAGATICALAIGVALAGVQLVPLVLAVKESARGVLDVNTDMWSVHPLSLLEVIAPQVFGNTFVTFIAAQPWLTALNTGRDPFFLSVYVGIVALMLAIVGLGYPPRRRWSAFWLLVGALALIAAFGSYTPIYPAALAAVPPLRVFRFPAKYLLVVTFAVAALVVAGWSAVERREARAPHRLGASMRWALAFGTTCAVLAYVLAVIRLFWPEACARTLYELARWIRLPDPVAGVEFLIGDVVAHAARLFLMAALGGGLLWLAGTRRPEARVGRAVLFAAVILDLLITNRFVNPTAPLAVVKEPSWIALARQHPHERFYFGARFEGRFDLSDFDAPTGVLMPSTETLQDARVLMGAQLVTLPSAFGVREMVSYDLPSLLPRPQRLLNQMVHAADREHRRRFLARAGVRYCFRREEAADPPALARIPELVGFAFTECHPDTQRAYVTRRAGVLPKVEDQLKSLFSDRYRDDIVLLQAQPPAPAGTPGRPVAESARFVTDRPSLVEIDAGVGPEGGYLVLLDSYDLSWRVEVDGAPAPLLRANGVFRAVRLAPGQHRVTFRYSPVPVFYGAGLSSLAALGLFVQWWRPRAHPVRTADASSPLNTILIGGDNSVRPT